MKNIIYKKAETTEELYQILDLQHVNIRDSISKAESKSEGFVTVQHDFSILKAMNNTCAHTIAKSNGNVIGYALSMVKAFKEEIPVLKPMFKKIDSCVDPNLSYITMGQICIDKAFRKQGVFRGLYNAMKTHVKHEFDAIITEVDGKNTRSLNAHKTIGFKLLKRYMSNNQNWELIIWNWT
ncbi:GNAT family N-acetyltransferase [Changchengzhania lutea]|uniref:GNAT family N-acetyltransferase n=1 Tax=Changchengzhania lutea TaxID=2049305 RepID=UPI001FE3E47C|nr:GNAT family N-acetyltransferase [Changchengzhania lutea]